MADYLVNPRRSPRAASRCRVKVQAPGAAWDGETEDIGAHGCQLIAPGPVSRGTVLQIVVGNPKLPLVLQVAGKVAWVSSQPPWRVGVSYAESARPAATRWFEQLVAATPGLAGLRRVPERLPVDAMVFLGPPPRLVDFTPAEVEVLRHVVGGRTLADLRAKLGASWPLSVRALFSLLARGALTVTRAAAAHPEAWKAVMAEYDTAFVVEAPPARPPPPTLTRTPLAMPRYEPTEVLPPLDQPEPELPDDEEPEPEPEVVLPERAPPPVRAVPPPPVQAAPPRPPPRPGQASAGTGWRGAARERSGDAQAAYHLGLQELAAGRVSSALAHLRHALQIAPGDAEVAAALARAMKG